MVNSMNPLVNNEIIDDKCLMLTLSNVDVCFANAIRRTILSDIEICCILSEFHETNQVNIEINTGRLHNEILKQRLSCIPVHFSGTREEMEKFCDTFKLEIDCKNDSDIVKFVTTEDFHLVLRNNQTSDNLEGVMADISPHNKILGIFPPCKESKMYIDFSRLRPRISDSIPGERLKLDATFSISNAKYNSMYNVVSKCTYANTIDKDGVTKKWNEKEKTLREQKTPDNVIEFEKKNFMILDSQRIFIPDSFDFTIEGLGIHTNMDIFKQSCSILISKFNDLVLQISGNEFDIDPANSTMDNSYDCILKNEDYTIGKILEYIIYSNHYVNDQTLTYCGFKKYHPHDNHSILRFAFKQNDKIDYVNYSKEIISNASNDAIKIFENILLQKEK